MKAYLLVCIAIFSFAVVARFLRLRTGAVPGKATPGMESAALVIEIIMLSWAVGLLA